MCLLILFRRQFKVCFQLFARLCHGYSTDEKASFSSKFSFACMEFLASVLEGKGEMISFVEKTNVLVSLFVLCVALRKIQSKSSANFMIIRITHPNLLHISDSPCFLFMNY